MGMKQKVFRQVLGKQSLKTELLLKSLLPHKSWQGIICRSIEV